MANGSLTRDQVLDELQFLATVEHALIVQYLSVQCALGHDLAPEHGGPTTPEGKAGVVTAVGLAIGQMFELSRINFALVAAGREEQVTQQIMQPAISITGDSGEPMALSPPNLAQLQQLVERGRAIATAVDQRYARLVPAVTTHPVFEGDLLNRMRAVIVADDETSHSAKFAELERALGGVAPGELLRATRRQPADKLEDLLLTVSQRAYGLVLSLLRAWFRPESDSNFRQIAFEAMEALDDTNRALVTRGMLPPFLG